jgi:hypothetical protein
MNISLFNFRPTNSYKLASVLFVLSKKKFVGGDHFVLTSTDLFVLFKKFVCSVLLRD